MADKYGRGRPPIDRTKEKGALRDELISKLNFEFEFTDLLGPGDKNKHHCFNKTAHKNGDATPSLSYNMATGAWRCHACGEKGDLFTLYGKIRKLTYPEALKFLYQRYGLWNQVILYREERGEFKQPIIQDENIIVKHKMGRDHLRLNDKWLRVLLERYGLTKETICRWDLAVTDGRLSIPIWKDYSHLENWNQNMVALAQVVNFRKHDIMRSFCNWQNLISGAVQSAKPESYSIDGVIQQRYGEWKPVWAAAGKVLGVKGYNSCYLYPFEVAKDNSVFYLVGGELKALLLNQLGIPAVAFTSGEGNIAMDFLPFLFGKRIRVLMDADPAGEAAAERMSVALASQGVYVEKAIWPENVKQELPSGGDVTDLLAACNWDVDGLKLLKYVEVEAPLLEDEVEKELEEAEAVEVRWSEANLVPFSNLVDPNELQKWVRLGAIISGRGETPYVVPRRIEAKCQEGKLDYRPICNQCKLPAQNFCSKKQFSTEEQLEMVGQSKSELENTLRRILGIPKNCSAPKIDGQYSAVENINVTPTVDHAYSGDIMDSLKDDYRYHPAYILKEERVEIKENASYEFLGKIIPEPRNNKFTFAIREARPLENDILTYHHDQTEWNYARSALGAGKGMQADEIIKNLTTDLRENVCAIYQQDRMLQSILLSLFLPFSFRLGQFYNERICPSVMVMGDTTVGKSTATQRLLRFFGAGRMANAGGQQTFVGLLGGNLQLGSNRMTFSWGLIPTSHRGFVALDEYHKLNLEHMGAITNTISSGIAERITASGTRRTKSWVRFLYLCNPRELRGVSRPLGAYVNPMDACLQVCGTSQDLGRIDYVHIQYQYDGNDLYDQRRPLVEQEYTKGAARTHLCWAWSRQPEDFEFEDQDYLLAQSKELANKYGHHTLLIPAHLRFKLAKFAIAFALLCMSESDGKVLVTRAHVDLAVQWFDEGYAPYIEPNSRQAALMPVELVKCLDQVPAGNYRRIRLFLQGEAWSLEDVIDSLGKVVGSEFLDLTQFNYRLISRRGRLFYPTNPEVFHEMLNSYFIEREKRLEATQATSDKPVYIGRKKDGRWEDS